MPFVLLISIIFSLFIIFLSDASAIQDANPLSAFVKAHLEFVKDYYFLFTWAIILLALIFLYKIKFSKNFLDSLKLKSLKTAIFLVSGFFASFILLFVIAIIHLNAYLMLLSFNPSLGGIEADSGVIANKLKLRLIAPEIIARKQNEHIVLKIAQATSGTNNLYGSVILPSAAKLGLIDANFKYSNIYLMDNKLIISNLDKKDLPAVSPFLGYLFVKKYFPYREVRSFPNIEIKSREEYLAYRKQDIKSKADKIDLELNKLNFLIGSLSASLETLKAASASTSKSDIAASEKLISEYTRIKDFYALHKQRLALHSENIPRELGMFLPPDTIKIEDGIINGQNFGDFFTVLVHEYLHYASYVSEKKYLNDFFFEEGLTEYFTEEILKNHVDKKTKLSYPVQVAIISEITKNLTEREIADIYFTKDQDGLEKTLDRIYGDGFYRNNKIIFETLQYSSSQNEISALTREIMKRIGSATL